MTVVCPGFAVDCLETLEEIDLRYRAAFFARGGDELDYVAPCLNATESHVQVLERLLFAPRAACSRGPHRCGRPREEPRKSDRHGCAAVGQVA